MQKTPGHSLAQQVIAGVFGSERSCCTARAWSSFLRYSKIARFTKLATSYNKLTINGFNSILLRFWYLCLI